MEDRKHGQTEAPPRPRRKFRRTKPASRRPTSSRHEPSLQGVTPLSTARLSLVWRRALDLLMAQLSHDASEVPGWLEIPAIELLAKVIAHSGRPRLEDIEAYLRQHHGLSDDIVEVTVSAYVRASAAMSASMFWYADIAERLAAGEPASML